MARRMLTQAEAAEAFASAPSGRFLRRSYPERTRGHVCDKPRDAEPGAVWQCDCGRRYTCVHTHTRHGAMIVDRADWARRWWPWPRPGRMQPAGPPLPPVGGSGVSGAAVITTPGMPEGYEPPSGSLHPTPPVGGGAGSKGEGSAQRHCPGCRCER